MRAVASLICHQCLRRFDYPMAQYKYRRAHGAENFYCGRECAGLARRTWKSKAQKVAEKAVYDREYRAKNRDALKAKQRAWHEANYDPDKARIVRRQKREQLRAYFAAYRARPEWRRHKQAYDAALRSAQYGEFSEVHRALVVLNKELIRRSPDKYERLKARGYYQRGAQARKRNAQASRW